MKNKIVKFALACAIYTILTLLIGWQWALAILAVDLTACAIAAYYKRKMIRQYLNSIIETERMIDNDSDYLIDLVNDRR